MALEMLDFGDFTWLSDGFKRLQFGSKAQLAFLEDLYVLVNDGIPPNRAIEMLSQVTTGINKEIADTISTKISEGQALAEGMRGWFAPNIIEIIHVGEEGGALAETMRSAIKTLTQRSGTMGAFLTAVIYPMMVLITAGAVTVYLNQTVFKQFAEIKPIDEWPDAGRTLVFVANVIKDWWWLLIVAVVGVLLGVRYLMRNYVGELRPVLDTFPPFSLYRELAGAQVMETLGLLIANGVVFKNAIKVMQYQANPYVASHLVMMEHLLSTGKGNVAEVLSTGLISSKDILRLRVMAEVKGFEHGLIRMGLAGAEKNTKTLKLIGRILGGLMLALGAFLIITIIKGIYMTAMTLGGG